MNEALTTAEACAWLGIGRSTLYVLARRHRIRRVRLGRFTRWKKSELELLVQKCELRHAK